MRPRAIARRDAWAQVLVVSPNAVLNFFMAGPDLVTWELTALGAGGEGPYQLVIHHAAGRITEHFESVTTALILAAWAALRTAEPASNTNPTNKNVHRSELRMDSLLEPISNRESSRTTHSAHYEGNNNHPQNL